jgi:Na+/H+ antiporter NhaD/arsenite permease-like protein
MVILVLVTAVASAVLDNVTTVLLVAPVTFLVCERLAVPVAPYLIAEAMASNIGGTATLVGDPPNIIIASRGGLSYNDFLVHLAPLIVGLLVVFVGLCRWLFRSAFSYDPDRASAVMALSERDAIRDKRLLTISLAVLTVVTAAFVLHTVLHLDPAVVALVGGLVLLALSRLDAEDVAKDVEWPTLVFFAGLSAALLAFAGLVARLVGPRWAPAGALALGVCQPVLLTAVGSARAGRRSVPPAARAPPATCMRPRRSRPRDGPGAAPASNRARADGDFMSQLTP